MMEGKILFAACAEILPHNRIHRAVQEAHSGEIGLEFGMHEELRCDSREMRAPGGLSLLGLPS